MNSADSPRGTKVGLALGLCVAAAMCEGMDVQTAGLAAGGISRTFHPSPAQLGLFFAAASLGLMVGAVVGGRLADRFGRKPVLTVSIFAFGLCSLMTAATWNMPTLTGARLMTGLGLGGAMPNLIALAADLSGQKSRNTSIGLSYVGMPLGAGVTSLIALALPDGLWRPLFLIGGISPIVLAVLIASFLKTPASESSVPAHELRPVSDLFAEGRLARTVVMWVGFFAAALTLHLILNWLPLLMEGRGLSRGAAATAQVAFNIVGAAGALIAARGLDTRLRPASVMLAVAAVPAALLAIAQGPPALALVMSAAGLLGAGILAQTVVLFGVAGDCYPKAIRGTGMGAAVGATRVGSLVGPSLGAVLVTAGRSPPEVLTALLPVVFVAAVCVVWLGWRAPRALAPVAA